MSGQVESPAGLYDAARSEAEQRRAFTSGEVPVAVYGLGKIGLPLAAVYAEVTGNTTGVDIDESVVETVAAGGCHVKREPGLPELVSDVVEAGDLEVESDPAAAAADAAVHVLVVPTLLTDGNEPDLSMLEAAAGAVGAGLSAGDLVVVESTVPPRTTADRIVPILAEESGLGVGEFGAAACPERTSSGRALADIRGTHPKVVGGVDPESTSAAAVVYDELTDNEVILADDAATAEAVKVFEGVYRDVNIALANQLAMYADALDVDVNAAIDVANTQPFCDLHTPGPGVGGHCIPVYPYFLTETFDVDAPVLETARALNDRMPAVAVEMLRQMVDDDGTDLSDATVLLAGVTFRAGVEELRNAPSIPIARQLRERGATVEAVDPLVDDWNDFEGVERVPLSAATDRDVDAVAVLAPHDDFDDLDWDAFDAPILDGRRGIDDEAVDAPVYRIGGRWP